MQSKPTNIFWNIFEQIKGVLVAGFMRTLGLWKCSKLIWGDKKEYYRPNYQRKILNFLCFFDFFLNIFFKRKFKNNVLFNLTTKTTKYHLGVSQFFSEIFSRDLQKFIFWVRGRNLKKNALEDFLFGSSYLLQKFKWILTFNLGGDRFSDEQSQKKRWFIAYSRKNIALFDKNALQKF
jgi:hypothetical protein